jgi:hypothetical protein
MNTIRLLGRSMRATARLRLLLRLMAAVGAVEEEGVLTPAFVAHLAAVAEAAALAPAPAIKNRAVR